MDVPYDTVQGAPALRWLAFVWSSPIFSKMLRNFQSAKGPTQCKSGPGNNMVGRRNHLLGHFSITIHLQNASFHAKKKLLKKKLGEALIEQIIKFELRGRGPPFRT